MRSICHQFVDRESGRIITEKFIGDKIIELLYSSTREKAPLLFRALTSSRISNSLLAFLKFDTGLRLISRSSLEASGIHVHECLNPEEFTTMRKVFERKIRYWECRPEPSEPAGVLSPADAKVIVGSLSDTSHLFVKEKFFDFEELLGKDKKRWLDAFQGGDFAIFRLTPEKYHYNHTPVAGQVLDFYEISGSYHSCNPSAIIRVVTPFSKNKRVVTIIDSDVPGGTGVGLVAMVEVVALMIGDVVQAYSESGYDYPKPVVTGMFLRKGLPKSLYRPGSSTDILLFQSDRILFSEDLVHNQCLSGVQSRFSKGFGQHLVETDVKVRSIIASSIDAA